MIKKGKLQSEGGISLLSPFLVSWREPFFHLFTLSPFYF